MKKFLLGALIGIVLAVSATAFAASNWIERGATYECKGYSQAVFCKETNWSGGVYQIGLYPGAVAISYKGKIIAFCDRKHQPGPGSCTYRYTYGG